MAGGVFKGTNLAQDQRFGDATQKLMSQMTFGSQLKKRVDMSKVNMEVIKPWIASKIKEALGLEDEVLFEFVINMLEESNTPDPKAMQVNLTGFLESKTQEFMQSLWTLLLEAQKGLGGMPESLIRSKVEEIRRQRVEQSQMRAAIETAAERAREPSVPRRTRTGRKSRWDAPADTSSTHCPVAPVDTHSRLAESSTAMPRRSSRPERDSPIRHSRRRSRSRDRGRSASPPLVKRRDQPR